MAENKNQSYANWPSVSGRSRTGTDMSRLNSRGQYQNDNLKVLQERRNVDLRLARRIQSLNTDVIKQQEALVAKRQSDLQRMTDLYSNYFQQFGGVLNKEALEFLDKHSKINVPTLTAIMAGYEHARASAADREMMALQQQEKLLQTAQAIEKDRIALEAEKATNAASYDVAKAKADQAYLDNLYNLNKEVYGVAGGRATGTRAGGVGGVGGGSAAGSFQAPVTGGGGTGVVTGSAATGLFNPNDPEFTTLGKEIADSKAAQTANQGSTLGPLSQQARTDSELITQWSDIPSATGVALGVGAVGRGLNWLGQRNRLGYLDPQNLSKYQTAQNDVSRLARLADDSRGVVLKREAQLNNILSNTSGKYGRYANDIQKLRDYLETNPRARPSASIRNALAKLDRAESTASRLGGRVLDAERLAGEALSTLGGQRALDTANKASFLSKGLGKTLRKIGAPASKLLGRLSLIGTGAEAIARLTDEGAGLVAASAGWVGDRFLDLTGQTTREEALLRGTAGQAFRNRYEYYRDYTRAFQNAVIGSDSGLGLENEDVSQLLGRLSELGWRRESNVLDATNETYGFLEMQRTNPTAFRQALEALYQYDPHVDPTTGRIGQEININPLEFFNRTYSNAVYRKQAFIQENKAAQNQQFSNQQMAVEAEKAAMLGNDTHPFLAAMMKHYTDMGRQAGYDFHEGHAVQFGKNFMQFIADMESGNKQGAVGDMTSTGTAKSRYQMMDGTFRENVKWMLAEDDRAGNQLLSPQERNILREASTKDANFLDNNGYDYLLGFMTLLYPLKSSVSASKFGKGNPDIRGDQMIVDMIQTFKNGGNQMSPYLLNNMAVAYAGPVWGRTGNEEFNKIQNRVTGLIQSQYGPSHTASGVFTPDAQYAEILGSQGFKWGNYGDPTIWRDTWVRDNFEVGEDGKIGNPKSTFKTYDQWKTDKGLERAMGVGKPMEIVKSNNVRLDKDVNFDGLNRTLRQRVNRFADNLNEQYGFGIDVTSGHRTPEHQARVQKDPNSKMPTNPGSSSHQAGLGIDISIRRLKAAFNKSEAAKQKYGGNFNDFVKAEAEKAGLYRFDPVGDEVHFSMIMDDDYKANVDHDLYMKDKAAGKLSDSKRYEKNQGWSLPTIASRPFAAVEYPEMTVEQPVYEPWQVEYLDQGMATGGTTPYYTDYTVAMDQMNQYNQQQLQQPQQPQQPYVDQFGTTIYP